MTIVAKLVQKRNTGERHLDNLSRECAEAVADLYKQLPGAATSRLMPLDVYTQLWWPCDDASGVTILRNIGHTTGNALTVVGTANAGASSYPQNTGFFIGGNTGGATGATGTFGAPPGASLSWWARLGSIKAAGTDLMFGFFDTAGVQTVFGGYLTNGIPKGQVIDGAATRIVTATGDAKISDGVWHHYAVTYSGTALNIIVDGVPYAATFAASAIAWTTGTPQWRIGYPGIASNSLGLFCDVRAHNCVRPVSWAQEAYRRGVGIF